MPTETQLTGVRTLYIDDLAWMHPLNEAHALELSSMSFAAFEGLVIRSAFCRGVDPQAAFVIALDQDAEYDSPNFLWFKARAERFLYVDRIVVAPDFRRRGIAQSLYLDVFECARMHGHDRVYCEVNSDPPNPNSDAFHAVLGFDVIGETFLDDRRKSVRYLERRLAVQ